jgi:uncharacterized protein (TIGR02145 family)
LGTDGDFYINTASDTLYGPKTTGGWGTGISLIGPKGSFPTGTNVGDMQYWNGSQWVMIPNGQSGTTLKNCDGQITWNPCKPSLTTIDATSITGTSFSTGGSISNDGDSPISVRGICWNTSPNPTITNFKTTDGIGTGSFSRTLTGLGLGSTLYVRAYATNSVGTGYGNQITVTTLSTTLPTVTTTVLSLITGTSATSGGNVTNDGGATISSRGVVWSTSPNPTIALTTKTLNGTGTGSFISNLTGLSINTTYYLRAYATNSVGTAYGASVTFTSAFFITGSGVTDVDGNNYPTIILGPQEWMAENLKTTKFKNGILIPLVSDSISWSGLSNPGMCWVQNQISNKSIYGGIYNWETVNTGSLCPIGWHVPNNSEWKTLEIFLGMPVLEADQNGPRGLTSNIGGKLKSTSTLWFSPNIGASNQSGFSALPGGRRNNDGSFAAVRNSGFWWSSTEADPEAALLRHVDFDAQYCSNYGYYKRTGTSIRCLKD